MGFLEKKRDRKKDKRKPGNPEKNQLEVEDYVKRGVTKMMLRRAESEDHGTV